MILVVVLLPACVWGFPEVASTYVELAKTGWNFLYLASVYVKRATDLR